MNALQFIARAGYAPVDDDLDRVNCPDAGKVGHQQCGWCEKCDAPRFQCSHILQLVPASRSSDGEQG